MKALFQSLQTRLKGFSSTPLYIGAFLALVLLIAFLGWLFWGLFFDRLHFWHMLVFCVFVITFCAWYSLAKNLRERYLALRIIEQLVALGFIILVILFLAGVI